MATHRRLVRESQRCLGAFKDPFHRRLLGGNARDEWISALSGWLRQKAQCVSFRVGVCVFACVCHPLRKIKVWNQMMPQHCHHQTLTLFFSTVIVASVDHLAAYTMGTRLFLYVMQRCLFRKSLPHLMCFESSSMAGNIISNCSLGPSLMIISINRTHKCPVIAM